MNILSINDKAPDFLLPDDSGNTVSMHNFRHKNIILYFYPKDDTPGCTREAKDFRNAIDEFTKLNTVILGVSRDSIDKHEEFKEKYELPFSLLSDEDTVTIQEYGVWIEKNMYGKKYMGIERSTFLISKDRIIKQIWRKVKVAGHVEKVLEEVKSLEAAKKAAV